MKRLQKGFTLIELLIVIAVIGILAGLVIVNFSQARNRAKDTRVISGLAQLRSQKEINYTGSAYTAASATLSNDINSNSKGSSFKENIGSTYVAWAQLSDDRFYCVDSAGASKYLAATAAPTLTVGGATPVAGSTACP
jgi:prepilin-type N-terminal cleavage/methylation domain-containing protein